MSTQVVMPPLSETSDEVHLLKWLRREGEQVRKGDPLFEVETDKAALEVQAPASGILQKILVPDDTIASVGTPVGEIADAV